jgi:tRNA(adenine34) deaminase
MSPDEKFMKAALRQAQIAGKKDEVPVGAVIVYEGKVLARGHNLRETRADPTAHAEIVAIRKAAKKLGSWRLCGCTLYVTLEPCAMCMGAIVNSRIPRVVFGAPDLRFGALGSLYNLNEGKLNHRCEVTAGVLAQPCVQLLKDYFALKRALAKKARDPQEQPDPQE